MLQEQIEIHKKMTPAERLQLAANFNSSARYFKQQCLRAQHPDWTPEQIKALDLAKEWAIVSDGQ